MSESANTTSIYLSPALWTFQLHKANQAKIHELVVSRNDVIINRWHGEYLDFLQKYFQSEDNTSCQLNTEVHQGGNLLCKLTADKNIAFNLNSAPKIPVTIVTESLTWYNSYSQAITANETCQVKIPKYCSYCWFRLPKDCAIQNPLDFDNVRVFYDELYNYIYYFDDEKHKLDNNIQDLSLVEKVDVNIKSRLPNQEILYQYNGPNIQISDGWSFVFKYAS
jgi:hypothetical protein